MSNRDDVKDNTSDLLGPSASVPSEIPAGVDRRKFIMRSAVISAAAVMNGWTRSEAGRTAPPPAPAAESARVQGLAPAPAVPLSADLNVVKKEKGPVLTT